MELPFALKKKKDGPLCYRIHPLFSLVSLGIALTILASSVFTAPPSVTGLILSFIALLGALYTEEWKFSAISNSIIYKTGFFPFLKKYEWKTAGASSVTLSVFVKGEHDQTKADALLEKAETGNAGHGLFPLAFPFAPGYKFRIRLLLEFKNGETALVDEAGFRSKARLASAAARIAAECAIPFKK